MKTSRKPVAMVLLLLIHLLTLQIGNAGRNHTNVLSAHPKIVLEEVTVTGSGNNTRVVANAVAEDVSKLDDEIRSLLSKREIRKGLHSTTTNLVPIDQDAAQSRATIVNTNEEDDIEDLEIMSRVVEKYEPQRLTSRKTKRKIVDGSNGTHNVHGKVGGPITELEKAYAEVLRNISRKAPELSLNNADVTRNPYLSQAVKQLKQVYIPKVTNRPPTNDGTVQLHSDIDFSFTSPALKSKKSRKLLKKYHQLNHTSTTPRFSSAEESRSDEETADSSNESSTPAGYLNVPGGKTKLKYGSSVPTSSSDPAKKIKSPKWNTQDFSIQVTSPFTLRLNNTNSNFNVNNLKNSNVTSEANVVQLPPSSYNVVPRPFSISPSANSFVTANIDALYRKPGATPTGFGQQQQIARSSANVLPLVLPTELFSSPPRRYIPIKRAKHLNLEGNTATVVSTEANSPTGPVGKRTTLDYDALYTAVIGTTRSPLAAVNGQGSPSDYYAVTESPAETTVTRTSLATTYVPSQISASYTVQRQKPLSQAARKKDFLPIVATYDDPNDEKSSLSENSGIALYNKFAGLYSTNIPNAQKAITQDFQQPSQQQASTLPYATLKSFTSTLLKDRPTASSKVEPYYDSGLLTSQDIDGKPSENNDENFETDGRSRVKDADETAEEGNDDNDNNDDNDDVENYKTRANQEAYKKVYKTPNKHREEEDRVEKEEDRYPQQSRNYGYQDKRYKFDENDQSSKDGRRAKQESVRHENDDDEEEVDETKEEADETKEEADEEEYAGSNVGESKDRDNDDHRRQYNKYEYDRDNFDDRQREKLSYDRKKDNKSKDRRDKDYESDVDRRFESNKYFRTTKSYDDDKTREQDREYHERFGKKKKLENDNKKDRRDRKYQKSEDGNVAEDKPLAQRSYRQDERYEEEQNNDDSKRNYRISPRKDSLREEHEEYDESNPAHVREEYRHQHVRDDPRGIDYREDKDNDKEEAHGDHVHGETQEHAHKHEEHEKKKHGGNHKFEEGGGAEHEEEHHGHKGEKGDKGYKVWHEHEKAEKGHHDKEHASKEFDEKGGEEKKHDEDGGYHEEHHHDEGGKKVAEFGEKGEHKKGHSTHGEHSVHKKDEFEKNTEFFDEFHEDGGVEKHGEHHHDHELKKGGHKKKGHHDSADHEEKHGKKEKHEKGGHHHEHKGHKVDEGHDHHYDHDHKYGKKEGREHGKKWSYKKGDDGGDAGGGHKHR
ncbi:uncharacterized protein LOC105833575 [Monomorium pharaonis]|uniref:uncharacterized protein LOC105833575 n=1 Tax=Monomorium pharaonis TaxID=307658 RepID=UPI001747385B|nr:uncharacterized protein LOC105833575 [Monomorium pharaonis]